MLRSAGDSTWPGTAANSRTPLPQGLATESVIGTSMSPIVTSIRYLVFPCSACLSLFATMALYEQPFTKPYLVLTILTLVLSARFIGPVDLRQPLASSARMLSGWASVLAILFFIAFAAKASAAFSRAVIIIWSAATPLLFMVVKVTLHRAVCRWNRNGRIVRTHVIVGATELARRFSERLEVDATEGVFIGFFADRHSRETASLPQQHLLGDLDDVVGYVRRNAIDIVHIATPLNSSPRLQRLLEELRDTTASIYFVPEFPEGDLTKSRIVEMAGVPLVTLRETPYCGLPGVAKRLTDVAITLAMLLLLWPVLLVVALAIRATSAGPIIFKQRRYGLNGEEFHVYKFRTMNVCEDGANVVQAKANDPRVTPLGKFLRKTSLDELPQLFCVLSGSMSLVGPRPHAVAQNEQYRRVITGYMMRHKVRPGITGWAQVNGLRGETKTLEDMRMRVAYDLDYLRHWSAFTDLRILWRTAWIVFRDRHAY